MRGLAISDQTVFLQLDDIFPECEVLLQKAVDQTPLHCQYTHSCPVDNRCMEKLVGRLNALFELNPVINLVILLWKTKDNRFMGFKIWRNHKNLSGVFETNAKSLAQFSKIGNTVDLNIPNLW